MISFTVPIEAETETAGDPLAIATFVLASGTPIGFQLSGSFQSELTAPVHNDVLTMRLPYVDCYAVPARGLVVRDRLRLIEAEREKTN